ncbi:MAG: GGDEF domain-containing protein [Elusimicrobia bacterium]|nr:GGDEF domain-containing protein [Elusimicrobiota bacterium]
MPQSYILLKQKDESALLNATQVIHQSVSKGNFAFVEIINADGETLLPQDPLGSRGSRIRFGETPKSLWSALAFGQAHIIRENSYGDTGPVIEGLFGIIEKDRILGAVILGVSTRPIQAALNKNMGFTLFALLSLLLISVLTSWHWTRSAARTLEQLTRHDSMTGLLNRQNIMESLHREIAIAQRRGGSVFIILADIDHFKSINDTLGHMAGDQVIRKFSKIISQSRRIRESVGRFGGEEFLIVLPETDLDGSHSVAEKILVDVRRSKIATNLKERVSFTVSMGIAGYPDDGATPEDVLLKSDRALYAAKSRGRDQTIAWRDLQTPAEVRKA